MKQNELIRTLERKLGKSQKRNNGEYGFECPKCSKRVGKYHMGVNANKGFFNCFRCGYSGHISKLGIDAEGIRVKKAVLAERLSVPELPKFLPYTSKKLSPSIRLCIDGFLESRSISRERGIQMGVGYSLDPALRGRLLIPIIEGGLCIYWVARLMVTEIPPDATDGYSEHPLIKEMGPRSGLGWHRRSDVIYGLDEVPESAKLVLVEGIFDAEHLKLCGFNAVSLLGSNISDVQVGKILSKNPSHIVVFFDGDEGGRKGAKRTIDMIKQRYRGPVSCINTPDGVDPDDCPYEVIKRYLDNTSSPVL